MSDLFGWLPGPGQTILFFFLALFPLVLIHELGHFLVAKACGVKCEKFYIGFDVPIKIGPFTLPSALFRKTWGETEYGVGIIPLGGYVKMLGQDDNPANAAKEADRIRVEQAAGRPGLDPRSYPAKSVPQRMAIISAGVIMNLIFAVIFSAIAYKMGLIYTPCIVGGTVPGDPAWQANLQTGDKIIQLGRSDELDETLRYVDLRMTIAKTGIKNSCEFLVRRDADTEQWITIQPSYSLMKRQKLPTIGLFGPASTRIANLQSYNDIVKQATVEAGLDRGDRIVSAEANGDRQEFQLGHEIDLFLRRHRDDVVTLHVDRTAADSAVSSREIKLSPRAAREVGFTVVADEISAIQDSSPAKQAGLQVGDRLLAVDGEEFDPLFLDNFLARKIGQPVVLTVLGKGKTAPVDVTIVPMAPHTFTLGRIDGPVAVDTLGFTLQVTNKLQRVDEDSPAARAGLNAGDVLQSVQFVVADPSKVPVSLQGVQNWNERFKLDDSEGANWGFIFDQLQNLPEGVAIELSYKRESEVRKATLRPRPSADFHMERNFLFDELTETRTASTLSEAVSLGVRETKESIQQVFVILSRIKDLYRSLGGPGTIAYAATKEASAGLPRLLVFLTLLSANLAVLNFLPIPVLDGGHMVFLAYEGLVGKPVNERIAFGLTMMGLTFILGLMVFVIGMDVYRFGFSG